MKRLVTALAAGAAISTIAFASASVLTVDGSTIQHGADGVSCDADGVKANWGLETDDNSVRNVRVAGIDTNCVGDTMFVKVDNKPVVSKVITAAGQETFAFTAPFPTPESINSIKIWIEG